MKMKTTILSLLAAAALFSGCDNSSNDTQGTYKIILTNNTSGQVMAPMAASLHRTSFHVFESGESASLGLEALAEGGAPTNLLDELNNNDSVISAGSNGAVIPPQTSATVTLTSNEDGLCLSVVAMLVLTNDGFAGTNCSDIEGMDVNDKRTINLNTYDAGTEANTETAATVPGLKGEGFNATRDDENVITSHLGIQGIADLDDTHKWEDPSATITIERIQ